MLYNHTCVTSYVCLNQILELEQLKRRKAELRRERDRRERQLLEHLKDQAGDLQVRKMFWLFQYFIQNAA